MYRNFSNNLIYFNYDYDNNDYVYYNDVNSKK